MSYLQKEFTLRAIRSIAQGFYSLTIYAPEIASTAAPGQFVHIRIGAQTLRRPISISQINSDTGEIILVIEVRGKGTEEICALKQGDSMDLLGPLGNGFALLDKHKRGIVVGGGIGTAPMLAVCEHYKENCTAILGFRDKSNVILEKEFAQTGAKLHLCTDNGSYGFHGFTTEMLEQVMGSGKYDIVYACGPKPMLKGIGEIAAKLGVRCQLSMDERMACGIGACLGCACKTKKADGSSTYSHACKHGPVFEAETLDFN